jgi:hypothetical protein
LRGSHLCREGKLRIGETLSQALVRQQQLDAAGLGSEGQHGMQGAGMYDRQRHRRSAVKDHTGRTCRQGVSIEEYNVPKLDSGGGLVTGRAVERDTPSAQKPFHLSTCAEARCC